MVRHPESVEDSSRWTGDLVTSSLEYEWLAIGAMNEGGPKCYERASVFAQLSIAAALRESGSPQQGGTPFLEMRPDSDADV